MDVCDFTFDRGDVEVPERLAATIARTVAWLESVHPELRGCSVTVSGPVPAERHAPYRFRMTLRGSGMNVVVCGHADTQVRAALSSAFDAAHRLLGERMRTRRGAAVDERR